MKSIQTTEQFIHTKLRNMKARLAKDHGADTDRLDELERSLSRPDEPGHRSLVQYAQRLHHCGNMAETANQIREHVGSDAASVPVIVKYLHCFRDTTCVQRID